MYDAAEILGKKGCKGEIYFRRTEDLNLGYEGWKLKKGELSEEAGYSVRVIKDGRIGFSGTTSPKHFDDAVQKAIETSAIGEELDLEFPGRIETADVDVYDEKLVNVTREKLMDWAKFIIDGLGELRDECELKLDIGRSVSFSELTNTSGAYCKNKKTSLGVSVELSKMEEGDILMIFDLYVTTHLDGDFEKALREMVDRLRRKYDIAKKIVPFKGGRLPVVFHPEACYALLLPFFSAVNGMNVVTGSSPLTGRLGEKIFDSKLSIADDGSIKGRAGSSAYDSEGFPRRKLWLIEEGVLRNYLLDIVRAKKLGLEPTGTSSRGIFHAPHPSISNIVISAGDLSVSELIGDIKEGIILHDLLGVGQGNILSGAFSNPVSVGLKIEDGEIVGRVKNIAIAGNIYENLKEITAISKERTWQWGNFLLPYIRLDNITLAVKG